MTAPVLSGAGRCIRLAVALAALAPLAQAQPPAAAAYPGATAITLAPEVAVSGTGAQAEGQHVLISVGGTYLLSGKLSDGYVEVEAPGQAVTLVLADVDIANSSGPAILIRDAGEATVVTHTGTHNVLRDGGASEFDAALYSTPTLTLTGSGRLDVHAVYEGIASTVHINIAGGEVRVWAGEDGLNANEDGVSQINITGGYLFVESHAGDALDSNGTLTISGGTVVVHGSLIDGDSALDADLAVTISGGTVLATGGWKRFGLEPGQPALIHDFNGTYPAGTLIVVLDESGEQVATFAPPRTFQQLVISSDAVEAGGRYTVHVGGVPTGPSRNGVYQDRPSDLGMVVASLVAEVSPSSPGPRRVPRGRVPEF